MTSSRNESTMSRRPAGLETAAAPGPQTALGESATFARSRLSRPLRALALSAAAWLVWPAVISAQDGALDTSFGQGGFRLLLFSTGGVEDSYARDMAVRPDGRIVIAGSVYLEAGGPSHHDFGLAQLEPDGWDDLTFGDGGRVLVPFDYGGLNRDTAWGVALDPWGRIVVAGAVERSDGSQDFGVARLWANGALDPNFNFPFGKVAVPFDLGGEDRDHCRSVVVQPDGKIVLAGAVLVGTDYDFGVARLTVDGALDGSFGADGRSVIPFDPPFGFSDWASDVALQPDGKLVVVGSVDVGSYPDFQKDFGVTRLWPDGTVDTSFGQPYFNGRVVIPFDLEPGLHDQAYAVAIQPDGRMVIAGSAERGPGLEPPGDDLAAARLLPGGGLDPEFGAGGRVVVPNSLGVKAAYDIAVQPDGKILLAGVTRVTRTRSADWALVRLQRNGSLDPTFGNRGLVVLPIDLTSGGYDYAAAIALQGDGKILLAGGATVQWTPSEVSSYFVVARLLNGLAIFADGFESGDTAAWSASVP